MSYKPAVQVYGEEPFYKNGLSFATYDEAEAEAKSLSCRWTMVRNYRVEESDEPVNYRWDETLQKAVGLESK